jgi:hypothetical protein
VLDILEILGVLRDLVVIVGVGMGIRLISEQLKLKKAENELLHSRIAHLEKMSAPALLEQVEKMAPALDRYVGELINSKRSSPRCPRHLSKQRAFRRLVVSERG